MRGKGDKFLTIFTTVRITPAYAGKSCTQLSSYGQEEDHPRLCGEKCHHCALKKVLPGSPPPMRGKVKKWSGNAGFAGITPAYAGKSYVPAEFCLCHGGSPPPMRGKVTEGSFSYETSWDHPRLCGEKHTRHCVTWKQ